jgi:hypothetical protein
MRIKEFVKGTLSGVLTFVVAAIALTGVAFAQVPSSIGPYNSDFGAVITNTARAPGTVNSAQQSNASYGGVVCTWYQASASGSASTTIAIQGYDSASATYQQLAISGALTSSTTPVSVMVYPGIASSGLANSGVSASFHLPRFWRVQQVNTGASTTSTGTVGCGYLK